jgi:hypothetical protein
MKNAAVNTKKSADEIAAEEYNAKFCSEMNAGLHDKLKIAESFRLAFLAGIEFERKKTEALVEVLKVYVQDHLAMISTGPNETTAAQVLILDFIEQFTQRGENDQKK